MHILQATLFPRIDEFSAESFETFLASNNFESVVSTSVQDAFNYVSDSPLEIARVKSDVMNERVFCLLRDNLLANGLISECDIMTNRAGNVKNCFTMEDYIFVINKAGASQNDTKITDNINNQSCDKDILQIQYAIDNSWTELTGLRFVYSLGGTSVYIHDIPLVIRTGIIENSDVIEEVAAAKVSLKAGLKKHTVNE